MATFIWKPSTISSWKRKPVLLIPGQTNEVPVIKDAQGNEYKGQFINYNEGRSQFGFDPSLISGENLTVSFGGQTGTIGKGGYSYEGGSLGDWQARAKGSIGDPSSNTPGLPIPGTQSVFPFTADPSMIQFNPINYNPITAAPFQFTDPIEAARRYAAYNLEAEGKAYETGKTRGRELTALDQEAGRDFALGQADLQQQLVAQENAFNQAQKLGAVEFAIPGIRGTLEDKRKRAGELISGRLPSSIEDRAFEMAARSSAADSSYLQGFGQESLVGQKVSDTLSAQQRFGLSMQGENLQNAWLQQAANLLVDSPLKANISQQIQANPRILPSQQASQQQSIQTSLTTVPPQFGISSEINQQQFSTQVEQGTRTFNASNTLAKDQFNATGQFNASVAQFNATQSSYDRVNAANQLAQDQIRADAAAQAASVAAQQNIEAQQDAQNAGAAGQIGGIIAGVAAGGGFGSFEDITGGIADTISDVFSPFSASTSGAELSRAPDSSLQAPSGPVQLEVPGGGVTQQFGTAPQQPAGQALYGEPTPQLSGVQVAQGTAAFGKLADAVGAAGTPTPHFQSFGRGLQSAAQAAQTVVSQGNTYDTPEAKTGLISSLENAAVQNAGSPEEAQAVQNTYAQIRDNATAGVPIKGVAKQVADFVNNFDNLTEAQKVRGFVNASFAGTDMAARLGLKDLSAQSIEQARIPGTDGMMTLGNALSLAKAGYNVHSLVDQWDDLSEIHGALGGPQTLLGVAQTAKSMGFLGDNTPETRAATASSLRSLGAQDAPAYGVGAVSVPAATAERLPELGFTRLMATEDQSQVIAVPNTVIASTGRSTGVLGTGTAAVAANANGSQGIQGSLGVGEGAYNLSQGWLANGATGRRIDSSSGAPIVSGMYRIGSGVTDPYTLGVVLLGSLAKRQGMYASV